MGKIAENSCTCECGASVELRSVADCGVVVICAHCARVYSVQLVELRWSQAAALCVGAFGLEWTRNGVPPEQRRTLPERRRFKHADRGAVALFVTLVLVLLLVLAKAVCS